MSRRLRRLAVALDFGGALFAAGAGLAQLALLAYIFAKRLTFPVDLEWMESGMLCHALRLMRGDPLYAEPSADFISYLYTPFYPATVAALSHVFGLSYALARSVSVLAFAGTLALVLATVRRHLPGVRGLLWGVCAAGLIASGFPHSGAWFDLARNDSLYLLLVMAGLYIVRYRRESLSALVLAGVLLGLAFLTKQTASFFIVFSGVAMLLIDWRRLPILVASVGGVAGGCAVLLSWLTDGWFWEYIFRLHQGHAFTWARVLEFSPPVLFKAAPVVASLAGLWLLVALVDGVRPRQRDASDGAAVYWFAVAITGFVVACVGFGTQWAAENAFIPGLAFPALFAALAAGDIGRRLGGRHRPLLRGIASLLIGGALGYQLIDKLYDPAPHVPTDEDRKAAQRLLALLRKVEGPIMIPYHPSYAFLVGQPASYHQMGVNDVTRAGHPYPKGIRERVASQYYQAIVLDASPRGRYDYILGSYKFVRHISDAESPRVFTGYRVRPRYLFVPKRPEPPPAGTRRVFDFESGTYDGWTADGRAFGSRPAGGASASQHMSGPYEGRYLASSRPSGDYQIGSLKSDAFVIDHPVLTYRVGGGNLPAELQVRLWVDGRVVHRRSGTNHHLMKRIRVDVSKYLGKSMSVELVDNARGRMGHLLFDELILWPAEPTGS